MLLPHIMASILEKLPTETLQHAASYLLDIHRESFFNLTLSSKTIYTAILPLACRQIKLQVLKTGKLHRDIQNWLRIFSRIGASVHVNTLTVSGFLLPVQGEEDEKESWELTDDNYYGEDEIDGHTFNLTFTQDGPTEVKPQEAAAWGRLAEFISAFQGLAELVWKSDNQFPPAILDVIHKHHPQCRLSVETFRWRTLNKETPSASEMALAISPCLHKIIVRHVFMDSRAMTDYNEVAVVEMIRGMSPSLKEVTIVECRAASSAPLIRARMQGLKRQPWKGFPGREAFSTRGSLEKLELIGCGTATDATFKAWDVRTDLKLLRYLSLSRTAIGAMRWVAENRPFDQLKGLEIKLLRDYGTEEPHFGPQAVKFFASLNPLESLSICGDLEAEIFHTVLAHHGPTLKKLELSPGDSKYFRQTGNQAIILENEHFSLIQAQCPLLEELDLSVRRRRSGPEEIEAYKIFGRIPELRHLYIRLDCARQPVMREDAPDTPAEAPVDPSYDAYESEFFDPLVGSLRNGDIATALLNAALDEQLAREIWYIIRGASPSGSKLQSLKLFPYAGDRLGIRDTPGHLSDIVRHISRCYFLEKDCLSNEDVPQVVELGRRAREAREETRHDCLTRLMDNAGFGAITTVFRWLWLPKPDSKDWRGDWFSLPLSPSATGITNGIIRY